MGSYYFMQNRDDSKPGQPCAQIHFNLPANGPFSCSCPVLVSLPQNEDVRPQSHKTSMGQVFIFNKSSVVGQQLPY